MDIDKERLKTIGGFAQRMVRVKGQPFKVILSFDQREVITGSSYVIIQLRVGKVFARRDDEYLSRRHGLIGQETTGVGGMAKALRTIPVMLDIAKDIHEVAPGALLTNFTNPAEFVTEALARYASSAVGVCNVGITTKMKMLTRLEKVTGKKINDSHAVLNTFGLNHLTWHRGLMIDGEEMWLHIFSAYMMNIKQKEQPEWDIRTLESLGIPPIQLSDTHVLPYYDYTTPGPLPSLKLAVFALKS